MSNLTQRTGDRKHSFLLPALCLLAIFPVLLSGHRSIAADHEIYPAPEQAKIDLPAALRAASVQHKRIILDFGGNWCGDCRVLDLYLHDATNRPILESNYLIVHINVGHLDLNQALAERYRIPLKKGVPALAVLDEHGKLLFSQESAEFEKMGLVESSAVTRFLIQWKPVKPGCSTVQINC